MVCFCEKCQTAIVTEKIGKCVHCGSDLKPAHSISYNINPSNELNIYLDDRIEATVSDCGRMKEKEIEALTEEVLNDNGYGVYSTGDLWIAYPLRIR